MDKFTLARLMGHSSPSVTERYYIHVTEPHVTAGFEKFVNYQTVLEARAKEEAARLMEEQARELIESVPVQTEAVQ